MSKRKCHTTEYSFFIFCERKQRIEYRLVTQTYQIESVNQIFIKDFNNSFKN